jgi:hypothetical protein
MRTRFLAVIIERVLERFHLRQFPVEPRLHRPHDQGVFAGKSSLLFNGVLDGLPDLLLQIGAVVQNL